MPTYKIVYLLRGIAVWLAVLIVVGLLRDAIHAEMGAWLMFPAVALFGLSSKIKRSVYGQGN